MQVACDYKYYPDRDLFICSRCNDRATRKLGRICDVEIEVEMRRGKPVVQKGIKRGGKG